MIIKTETEEYLMEGEIESSAVIHAQRSERQDGTYEIITKDKYGNYMFIRAARIEIECFPDKDGVIWEKCTEEHWNNFNKALMEPHKEEN